MLEVEKELRYYTPVKYGLDQFQQDKYLALFQL